MTRVRLNGLTRDRLIALSQELVGCPVEKDRLEAAYDRAEPLVRAAVLAKYPVSDMLVLEKYDCAEVDDCIKLQLTAGGVDKFQFDAGTGPLVAETTTSGAIYLADEETTHAFEEWKVASDAYNACIRQKLGDYRTLVTTARTLEDVTEIWPEAERVRPMMQSHALSALTSDAIERIKSDVASRRAA